MKSGTPNKPGCHFSDRDEKLDAYLNGELSDEDIDKLETHLWSCDDCFRELQYRKEVVSLVREEGDTLFADYLRKQKSKRKSRFAILPNRLSNLLPEVRQAWLYSGLAAIAIALVATILITRSDDDYEVLHWATHGQAPEDLSEQETLPQADNWPPIEPFPYIRPHTLGDLSEPERVFVEAMESYQRKDYENASEKLEESLAKDPDLKEGRFFLGVTHLFRNNFVKAVENLEIAVDQNPDSEKERWYLARAYLASGKRESSDEQLEWIATFGLKYQIRAQILLESGEVEAVQPVKD